MSKPFSGVPVLLAHAYAEGKYYPNKTPLQPADDYTMRKFMECAQEGYLAGYLAALLADAKRAVKAAEDAWGDAKAREKTK
jgi:hypothetical protein